MESHSEAIVRSRADTGRYAQDPTWQRTWVEIEALAWRSLAVIPTYVGSSIDTVHGLAEVAWQQRGHSVVVADIRTIALPVMSAIRDELRRRMSSGERILIASRSLRERPAAATIAREADGVILCVALGKATRRSVAEAIREIGKNRIVGTISLRSSGR